MSVYHNELDPYAAAWLRNLGEAGHIAPSIVDERSIVDVQPDDLRGHAQCHFFAGIGGWSYALRLAGWPDDKPVWTGSCPCQPLSGAGQRKGHADERHLWPAFYRLIAECRPPTIFGEQVASADGREWLAGVRADLEALGYAVGAADLCAAGVGAPHIRQRLYWMADAISERRAFDSLLRQEARGRNAGHPLETAGGCGARGLGDADLARPQGRGDGPGESGSANQRLAGPASELGFWSDYDVLPCTDGKARRTQSGLQPLAYGSTFRLGSGSPLEGKSRVAMLRGYGNAIVAPLAATFITEASEAMNALR